MTITKVTQENYNSIIEGYGWATSEYITMLPDLSNSEQYDLMIILADEKLLVNEGNQTVDTELIEEINCEAIYCVEDVEEDYLEFFELVKI